VDSRNRPLAKRLLSNRNLRARFLAHVRTIVDECLDWKTLGPVFEDYRLLIAEDVLSDTRNLSDFAEFFDADIAEAAGGGPGGTPPGMKRFIEERRKFLLQHAELAKPRPAIQSVELLPAAPRAGSPVQVVARVGQEVPVEAVVLYYAVGRGAPFQKTEMKAEAAGTNAKPSTLRYVAAVPPTWANDDVYYYVEARADQSVGTTVFSPPRAAMGALHYRAAGPAAPAVAGTPTVVINEVLASNTRTLRSPQGKFADWIELVNVGKEEVDLSGLHLTEDKQNLRQWTFPAGTTLGVGQYLIVWTDGKAEAKPGLHANFRLSKAGERVLLIDRDSRGNRIIDTVEFGPQKSDISYGRYPDGTGKCQPMSPTPGRQNSAN